MNKTSIPSPIHCQIIFTVFARFLVGFCEGFTESALKKGKKDELLKGPNRKLHSFFRSSRDSHALNPLLNPSLPGSSMLCFAIHCLLGVLCLLGFLGSCRLALLARRALPPPKGQKA